MTVWTEHEIRDLAAQFHAARPLKKDKTARAKEVLNNALLNTPLDGGPLNVALAVLAGHPQLSEKVGCGVTQVDVRPAMYGTRGFHITRADGSGTDFSYIKCLQPPSKRQDVHSACRNSLRADMLVIKTYRLALPEPTCQVTGLPITAENSHVHHGPPMFDVLCDGWAGTVGGHDAIAGRLISGDNVYGNKLDEDDARSWLTYHHARATLLLVHRTANAHIEAARRAIKKAG